MIDACKFDGKDCPNRPTFFYVWAWGEEGVCCDDHRATLETRSKQLERGITFSSLGRPSTSPRREYTPPQLREVPADVGALQVRLADAIASSKKLEQQITRLEQERETNVGKMREQELRIQDLIKQNGELKAAAANAELQAQAALELATKPADDAKGETVIEGTPDTQGGGGSRGKRSR